jgi:CDGSH-type Zn-finger protein
MADTLIVNADGPYQIAGPVTIVDPTGATVEVPEGKEVSLCRCGGSNDKPFCDGTHEKEGFQASNPARQRFKKSLGS